MIDILSYAQTRRYHTLPTIGHQTVAEHSGRMLLLLLLIIEEPSIELVKGILYHDLPECETGDVPAPAKWRNPKLTAALDTAEGRFICDNELHVHLTDREQHLLKWLDSIECAFYCVDQMMLGNRNLDQCFHNVMTHLNSMPLPSYSKAEQLKALLLEKYHGATR